MGQGKLHTLILAAGIFTLGAIFGHQERPAAAQAYVVLDEVVIDSGDCDGENEPDDSICGIVER